MGEDRHGQGGDVVGHHVAAAGKRRQGLGGAHQARAERGLAPRVSSPAARARPHEIDDVALDVGGDVHGARLITGRQQIAGAGDRRHVLERIAARKPAQDLRLLVTVG